MLGFKLNHVSKSGHLSRNLRVIAPRLYIYVCECHVPEMTKIKVFKHTHVDILCVCACMCVCVNIHYVRKERCRRKVSKNKFRNIPVDHALLGVDLHYLNCANLNRVTPTQQCYDTTWERTTDMPFKCFCFNNIWRLLDSPRKWPVMWNFGVFCPVSFCELFNKRSICRWLRCDSDNVTRAENE